MAVNVNKIRLRLKSSNMPTARIVSVQPVQVIEKAHHAFRVIVSVEGEEWDIGVSAEDLNDPFSFHTCVLETTGKFVEFEIDDIDQTQQWHDLLADVPWLEVRIEKPRRRTGPRRKSR